MKRRLGSEASSLHDPAGRRVIRFEIKRPERHLTFLPLRRRDNSWLLTTERAAGAHEQNANKLLEPHASIVRRLGCPKSRTFLMAAFPSCAETERIIVRSRARPAPGKRLQIHPEKLFQ